MKTVISCDIEPRPSMGRWRGDRGRVKSGYEIICVLANNCQHQFTGKFHFKSFFSCDHCAVEFMNIFISVSVCFRLMVIHLIVGINKMKTTIVWCFLTEI